MTVIENNDPRIQYRGPIEIGDELAINFPYSEKDTIKCLLNETLIDYNSDYTIVGNTATMHIAVAAGEILTFYRETPLDQQAEFPQNNRFDSAKLNESLDKICMQQQEQEEAINRCMKASITSINFDGSIPAPQANKALKINSNATGFTLSDYDPDLAINITNQYKNEAEAARDRAIAEEQEATRQQQEATRQQGIATAKAAECTNTSNTMTANYNEYKADLLADHNTYDADLLSDYNTYKADLAADHTSYDNDLRTDYQNYKADLASDHSAYDTDLRTDYTNYKNDLSADHTSYENQMSSNHNSYESQIYNSKEAGLNELANASNALRYTNISHGILEDPRRIDCDCSNKQTMIVRAGTEIVVPYGNVDLGLSIGSDFIHSNFYITDTDYTDGKYYVYVKLKNDITQSSTSSWGTGAHMVTINLSHNTLLCRIGHEASDTFTSGNYAIHYDTTGNIICDEQFRDICCSFPIGRLYSKAGRLTRFIEVFHNIGFIGYKMWIRKGVKISLANGRLANGQCNNIITDTNRTIVFTYNETTDRRGCAFIIREDSGYLKISTYGYSRTDNVTEQYSLPFTTWEYRTIFSRLENKWYRNDNTKDSADIYPLGPTCKICYIRANTANKKIEGIELTGPINVFDSLSMQDIVSASFPSVNGSNNRIEMTAAATGTSYIARYTGYIFAYMSFATLCDLHNNNCRISSVDYQSGNSTDRYGWIPVKAGDSFSFYYNGTVKEFFMIPARGAINSMI